MTGAVGAAAGPVKAAAICGAAGVFTASPPTCTYTTTGTDTFTVPAGVSAASFDLFGAEGDSAPGFVAPNPPNTGAPGGLGGEILATLTVSPGQVSQLTVGAAGINGSSADGTPAQIGGSGHSSGRAADMVVAGPEVVAPTCESVRSAPMIRYWSPMVATGR